jgi:F5/8 type C domain
VLSALGCGEAEMVPGGGETVGETSAPIAYLSGGWKATASTTDGVDAPPPNALDGEITTRWTTGRAQTGGEWFVVDLGKAVPMSQLVLDDTMHPTDYPVTYELEASNDGVRFAPVEKGWGTTVTIVCFRELTARYLRVHQTGTAPEAWWSIDELRVYP